MFWSKIYDLGFKLEVPHYFLTNQNSYFLILFIITIIMLLSGFKQDSISLYILLPFLLFIYILLNDLAFRGVCNLYRNIHKELKEYNKEDKDYDEEDYDREINKTNMELLKQVKRNLKGILQPPLINLNPHLLHKPSHKP